MSALGGIYTALKVAIAADSGVAALIANAPAGFGGGKAVYDEGAAPQGGSLPYITVGAGTQIPSGTLSKRGWNCTVQVKAVWSGPEATGQAIVNALSALLFPDGGRTHLTVSGFATCPVDDFSVQPTIVTVVAGAVTRESPVIVRVLAV